MAEVKSSGPGAEANDTAASGSKTEDRPAPDSRPIWRVVCVPAALYDLLFRLLDHSCRRGYLA